MCNGCFEEKLRILKFVPSSELFAPHEASASIRVPNPPPFARRKVRTNPEASRHRALRVTGTITPDVKTLFAGTR